jgi:hypothetical protein
MADKINNMVFIGPKRTRKNIIVLITSMSVVLALEGIFIFMFFSNSGFSPTTFLAVQLVCILLLVFSVFRLGSKFIVTKEGFTTDFLFFQPRKNHFFSDIEYYIVWPKMVVFKPKNPKKLGLHIAFGVNKKEKIDALEKYVFPHLTQKKV